MLGIRDVLDYVDTYYTLAIEPCLILNQIDSLSPVVPGFIGNIRLV
jgi:hypothetical protein